MLMFGSTITCNEIKWKFSFILLFLACIMFILFYSICVVSSTRKTCLFPSLQWSCRTLNLKSTVIFSLLFCVGVSICFLSGLVFMYVLHGYGALKPSLIFKIVWRFVFSFFRLALYIFFSTTFVFFRSLLNVECLKTWNVFFFWVELLPLEMG